MSGLEGRIFAHLGRSDRRWFDGLAPDLACECWRELSRVGLDASNYGTTRALEADPLAERPVLIDLSGPGRTILVEAFTPSMRRRYDPLGLEEASLREADLGGIRSAMLRALDLLDRVPGAGGAVATLVRSIHLLRAPGPEYDVGYSDPRIPFSASVAVHAGRSGVLDLRLAEGLLHEAMHLQLSLIEASIPLVTGNEDERRSPWQRRPRPPQGLLHGLYVFRVVQDFLTELRRSRLDAASDSHAADRARRIEEDCAELAGLDSSRDLAPAGRTLAEALLRPFT